MCPRHYTCILALVHVFWPCVCVLVFVYVFWPLCMCSGLCVFVMALVLTSQLSSMHPGNYPHPHVPVFFHTCCPLHVSPHLMPCPSICMTSTCMPAHDHKHT